MDLAFDTSGHRGSVAIGHRGEVLARVALEQRAGHASGLVLAIERVLEEAGVDRDEVEGIVVGEGPGSFTGVRVAAATAKGLVRALGCPLWSVSSLAATAVALPGEVVTGGGGPSAPRYVLFDARSERVYGGCWRVEADSVEEIVAPHGGQLTDVFASRPAPGTRFLGGGAEEYRARIEAEGFEVVAGSDVLNVADGLIGFRARRPDEAPVSDPGSWEPAYVRVSGAERMWPK